MKKLLPAVVFAATFAIVYVGLCYHPGLMIKLEAEPIEYFLESIGHMVLFKGAISLAAGLVAGGAVALVRRKLDRGSVTKMGS